MQPWQPLLDWWFATDELGPAASGKAISQARHTLWFGKRDSQDDEARQRFAAQVEQAMAGELQDWQAEARGWLAQLILLDQLPRMIFRDTPRAFAGDALAQPLLSHGLDKGWDRQLAPIQRVFAYLVFEHAEDLARQDRSVALFQALHDEAPADEQRVFASHLDYAERHQRIIARFGRFPHRNEILGRRSTDEERAFLREPGSRF